MLQCSIVLYMHGSFSLSQVHGPLLFVLLSPGVVKRLLYYAAHKTILSRAALASSGCFASVLVVYKGCVTCWRVALCVTPVVALLRTAGLMPSVENRVFVSAELLLCVCV